MSLSQNAGKPFFGAITKKSTKANLSVLGIPWDASSSYRRGATKAPDAIRRATSNKLFSPYTELNVNLIDKWQIFDWGDVGISTDNPIDAHNAVSARLKDIYGTWKKNRFLFLGGDHLATYFCFTSLFSDDGPFKGQKASIIYLDAHPDLYPHYEGNKYSHACVVRRIIEQTEINPKNIVLVGIRATTPSQLDYIDDTGITIFSRRTFQTKGPQQVANEVKAVLQERVNYIYLSIDLDILDPAFAPGLGNPEPGGLSTAELVIFIQRLISLPIFAFDIVELCPSHDHSNISAFAAAKLIKETLGIMR
ncbi:MAG: agmatinase [Candidatus Hodarchaeota archaeon]